MSQDTVHTCPFCGAKVVDLRGHIVRVHEDKVMRYVKEFIEVVSPSYGYTDNMRLLRCRICGRYFATKGLGQYHIVMHIIKGDIKVML